PPSSAAPHVSTLSLHDALPIYVEQLAFAGYDHAVAVFDRFGAGFDRCLHQPRNIFAQLRQFGGKRTSHGVERLAGEVHVEEIGRLDELGLRIITLYRQNARSEEHTSELQSRENLVCRLLLEKKNLRN